MARYDRIAPLDAPGRDDAFPGWLVLRDLAGRERDADLGRRARLRFLALRPVYRILDQGIDRVPADSYARQVEAVREELGGLPARDPERMHLARYLHTIREREPAGLAAATLELATVAASAGHVGAAEEFLLTSTEIAQRWRLTAQEAAARERLGALAARLGDGARAETAYARAAQLADRADDRLCWARALAGRAAAIRGQGRVDEAAALLRSLLDRAREWGDAVVAAIGAAGFAAHALDAGKLEEALEMGWSALPRLEGEARSEALAVLATAFARLGMLDAADHCHEIRMQSAAAGAPRLRARIEHAVAPAEAGDAAGFRKRRKALMRSAGTARTEPSLLAALHLALGRGCLLVGDTDFARDHLREAIEATSRFGLRDVPDRAGEMLSALERAASELMDSGRRVRPGETATRIAAAVADYDRLAVAHG